MIEIDAAPIRVQKEIQKLLKDADAQKTRDWNYYEKMRKEDKPRYMKPETQIQMEKDAVALGVAFGLDD